MSRRKTKIALLATIVSLALFSLVCGFAFPASALAWDNCPRGLVNDPYPGACRRYVDTNGDGICDLSQSKPADTTTTTALAVTTTTSGEPPTGDCPLGPCAGCGACFGGGITSTVADNSSDASSAPLVAAGGGAAVSSTGDSSVTTSTTILSSGGSAATGATQDEAASGGSTDATVAATATAAVVAAPTGGFVTHYLVSPLALGFVLIYGASFFLYKTRRIRIATHRKVWNMLLLATFLITGIFGVILAIQLDYPLPFTIPIDLLFWHVEAGIVMTFISLFHMGWHFKYYKNVVRNARTKMRAVRAAEQQYEADDRRLVLEAREARSAGRDARRAEREGRRAQQPEPTGSGPARRSEWLGPEPRMDLELE
jgi:hypothetical protein